MTESKIESYRSWFRGARTVATGRAKVEIDPIVHEDYNNPNQLSNDIALLKLAESVDLNMFTPACMAAKDADYTGKNGRVYGKLSLVS